MMKNQFRAADLCPAGRVSRASLPGKVPPEGKAMNAAQSQSSENPLGT